MRIKVAAATAAVLLAVVGCSSGDDESTDPATTGQPGSTATAQDPDAAPSAPEMPEMPEPDLEGIPDIVAEGDGVEVTGEEFARTYENQFGQLAMQAQMSGQELDQDLLKQQTAEAMVDTQLLLHEAADRDIAPTDEEIDAALENLAGTSGLGSLDEVFAALEAQGMDREAVMSELEQLTTVEQLVADEAGEFSASEEELRGLYDAAVAQGGGAAGGEVPEFEEIRPELEQQLRGQHEGEAYQALVAELRESVDVTYHL